MRLPIRPIAAMLLAVGVATCSEMTAGPRSSSTGKAHFALAPSFTPLADEAAASGEAQFDRVRIIITRPPDTTALVDKTVQFAPGDSDLSLSLDVDATAGEHLSAEIQYRTATTIFYDGHATVIAQVTSDGAPPTATPVTVDYVGPGATAKTVEVSPSSSSVATTSTQQLTATVRDDSGAPIDAVPIGWTSSDTAIATISAAGLVQPVGPRGAVVFTATTPTGLSGKATLTFVPPPSAIKTISGGDQSGVAGTALPQPFVVELDAADGGPVTGATVSFASAQGEVASATAVTDSLGRAQTSMTLGKGAGTEAFTAGVGTFVTSVSETATPGAAASIVVGASPAQGPAGSQTTLSAQLVDQYGNDVTTEKIPVTWSGGSGGALAATETETNANGVANNVFVSGLRPDVSYHIEAAAGSAKGSVTLSSAPVGPAAAVVFLDPTSFAVLPGPLSFTVASGDDQPNVPIARIIDASGVGVPGAQLTISITLPGGVAGPSTTATTDTLGAFPIAEANIPDQTFNAPGNYVISFSSPGVTTPATINVTVLGTVLTKVSGDKQTGSVGQALTAHPTVQLKDVNGKVLANHDVSFSPSSGGSVTPATAQTDANGNASTEWHLGSTLGAQTLTVSSDGAAAVTFTATAGVGPATHYTMTVSPSAPTAGTSVTVTAQLRDQFGNAVSLANRTVTWSGGTGGKFASSTSTTASDGSASVVFTTESTAASYQIHATDGTLSGDLSFSTAPAPIATSLALTSTPPPTATSGTAAAVPILVQALDAQGHPVGGVAITAAISGGFSLRGTTTATTDATTGTASFSALHYVGAGNATVTFSSTGLTPTSFALALSAAPADSLRLVGDASLSFITGTLPVTIPNVIAVDSTGTPVAGAPLIVAVSSSGVPFFADTTVTGSNGMLQVIPTAKIPSIPAGVYTVVASSAGLIGNPVVNVTVSPVPIGAPTHLALTSTTPATGTSGTAAASAIQVQALDANNHAVSGILVTASISSGFSLRGTTTATTNVTGGTASFSALHYVGAGHATVTFSASGLTPASFDLDLVAAPADSLRRVGDGPLSFVVGALPTTIPNVIVVDSTGTPVANVPVILTASAVGAPVFTDTSVTGSNGMLQFVPTSRILSIPAGAYTVTASSQGLVGSPASLSVTVSPSTAPATHLALTSSVPTTATSGTAAASPIQVQALDANNHAVSGIAITASIGNGFSLRGTTTASTDVTTGTADFSALRYVGAGRATVTFSAAGLTPASFDLDLAAAPADSLRLVGDASLSFVAGSLPTAIPNVIAVDSTGTPVANAPVIVSMASSGSVFFADTTVTGTDGRLQIIPTTKIPSIPAGAYTVTASSTGLVGIPVLVSVTVTAAIGPATHLAVSAATPATGISGTTAASPIQVQALDANNHAVSGIAITASISSGFSLRGTTTASTDVATGTASFSALHYVGAGHATVTFSASGLTPTSFALDLAAAPADSLRLVGDASLSFVAGSPPTAIPNVIAVDSTGTPAPNTQVIVAVSQPGVVLFADTTVTGSDGTLQLLQTAIIQSIPAGAYAVTATSTGLIGSPVQVIVTVSAPVLSLVPVTQPSGATNSVGLTAEPSVRLTDANNQPVANALVTIAATRLSGTPGSAALLHNTAITDASGLASFPQFLMTGAVGQFQLVFTAALSGHTISPLTSSPFTLVAGPATTLAAATDETIVQQAGAFPTLQTPPSVKIADVSGNAVSGVTPIWSNQPECLNDGLHLGTAPASSSGGLAVAPTVTLSNSETGTCVLVAKLTAESMSPTDTAAFIYVQRPVGITKVFTGNSRADSSKWSDPDNWSGHQVPAAADDVLINASVAAKSFPTLDVQTTIGSLTFEPGGFMTLDDEDLTVAGSVTTSDSTFSIITGTGHLILTGTNGSTLSAAVFGPGVVVGNRDACGTTHYTTSTFLLVSDLTLECPLTLTDSSYVGAIGNFKTEYGGSIEMHGAASTLSVLSSAIFNGASESTLITEGDLVFTGDFTQSGSASSFVASDSAIAYFFGDATQHISFSDPAPSNGSSRFAHLYLGNTTGGVVGLTNIAADTLEQAGIFTMNDGMTLTADFAMFDPGSTTNGGVLNAASGCAVSSALGTTFGMSLLGGVSECSLIGFIGESRRPAGITPLSSRMVVGTRTLSAASVSPRQQVCAIVRQLNRPVRSSIQAACRQ